MIVQSGSTNVTTYFMLRNVADGQETTGATITDIDLQYVRSGAAPAAKVDATALAATNSAHAANKAIEVDATSSAGLYRVDWPDAAFAAGAREVILTVTLADSFVEPLRVELSPDPRITLTGQASAGDTTVKITLNGGAATDRYYNGQLCIITGGTGAGQARTILNYLAAGNVATPTRDWLVAPDASSTFILIADDVPGILEAGTATAGAASTITLDATASAIADTYKNNFIMITGGAGIGQTRLIGAYSAGRVATVFPNWTTTPDTTSIYQVLPAARVDIQGWAGNLVTGDGDWAALTTAQAANPAAVVTALRAITPTAGGSATFDDILLAVYALARGKIAKSGSDYLFYDDDDSTVLYTLTIASAARTTA
jgi:hypothetical protein